MLVTLPRARQLGLAPAPIEWPTPYVTEAAITAATS
jgi:hypothetical protein